MSCELNLSQSAPRGALLSLVVLIRASPWMAIAHDKQAPDVEARVADLFSKMTLDKKALDVLFPFGHGLSYTRFAPQPPRELKGFQRISLGPGDEKEVCFEIDASALAFYDPVNRRWTAEPGAFEVMVGASSRDIRLRGELTLN